MMRLVGCVMRLLGCVSLLALLATPVSADDPVVKALAKDLDDAYGELRSALKTIKDRPSAEAAAPKLDAAYAKVKTLMFQVNILGAEQRKELYREGVPFVIAARQVMDQMSRVEKVFAKDAAMWKALEKTALFMDIENDKIEVAKVQIKELVSACAKYHSGMQDYPVSLQDLVKQNPPLLKSEKSLLDPWGKPYQYYTAGPGTKTQTGTGPDIWTVAPTQQTIASWDLGKKK